ncbi:MAG TPA: dihydrodipicolinate synthase family protein [Candidatus Sulfotelmatobacter sp.]|nr:dihydrodipicolinate synthase family protein [Candidatus Sulfotelmatobacter sp.]
MKLPAPLRGVVTAMITPLLDRDTLDVIGLQKLIDNLINGGVNGLFILGTTGEAPSLSYETRRQVITETCRHGADRLPVIVGITDTSYSETVYLAQHAAEAGAHGLVLAVPYYFSTSQRELVGYVRRLVSELPLPVFLYNAPSNVDHILAPDTLRKLSDLPQVRGVKDSGFEMMYFHKLVWMFRDRPDFTLLVGPEELTAEAVLMGGHGGMCGGSNIYPKLYVDLYNAAAARDLDSVRKLHARVIQISSTVYRVTSEDSSYLRCLKCAVSLMGICGDALAEPFEPLAPIEREQVRRYMVEAGLLK